MIITITIIIYENENIYAIKTFDFSQLQAKFCQK